MFPVLFKIGSFSLHTYGLILMIGVVLGLYWAARRAPRFHVNPDIIMDSAIWTVVLGVIGARVVYIVQEWDHFRQPAYRGELFSLQFSGLTSFGGIVFGFIALVLWCRWKKAPVWSVLDTFGAPLLVAQAIGRIGCLANGCCHGGPTSAWWGVPMDASGVRYFPAQLVDTALCLVLAWILSRWERQQDRLPGTAAGLAIVFYGLSRFIYEFFRAGSSSTYWGSLPITQAQAFSVLMMALGGVLMLKGRPVSQNQTEHGPVA